MPDHSTSVPERSLNRQVILEEDEYTAALSHIIARDFFPSLVHLDATNEYLDALKAQDHNLINASARRLEEISSTPDFTRRYSTPLQTPYGQAAETPFRTPRNPTEEPPTKRARYDVDTNLDSFQARYTSEDNSSFTRILDDENRKRREKWAWAWEAQQRVEGQRERMLEGRERMLVEGPSAAGVREKFRIEAPKPVGLITDGSEAEGGAEKDGERDTVEADADLSKALIKKDSSDVVDVMAPKKDARSAGVDGWRFKARNSLMFSPDSDQSPYHPSSVADKPDPKVVLHTNTRLPEHDSGSPAARGLSAPPSPTRSKIDAAISGTPYRPLSPPGTFSLVPDLPSPTPSELGPNAVKQLMTWGTLNATPRVISSSNDDIPTPGTPFRIAPPSHRESLSHRLSSDAARSLRAKAGLLNGGRAPSHVSGGKLPMSALGASLRTGTMAPPSWTPRRNVSEAPGGLTPAAKRLLDRTTMGTAAARRGDAMNRTASWEGKGKAKETDLDKVRWTPTPVTRRI